MLNKCNCRKCLEDRNETFDGIPVAMTRMIVCSICGNKRCPHATDHNLECTNNNSPGQIGSVYQ